MRALNLLMRRWFAFPICVAVWGMLAIAGAVAAEKESVSVEEFRKAIEKRDKVIIDLMRRVKELETRVSGKAPSAPTKSGVPEKVDEPKESAPQSATGGQKKPGTGQVVVDELTAQRALERSLVETGVLLLRPGQAEISPSFTFRHNNVTDATAVTVGSSTFVADRGIERDTFDVGLAFRHGLPWDSQFELSIPYRFVARDETTDILGSVVSSQDSNGHGVGDLRVGFAKTLLRAGDGGPDLIGRVTWDSGIGRESDDGVNLGFGFNELQGQLTALYRQDPMVFVGTFGYEYAFEKDSIQPGDEFQFFLGTSLAVSPETSLSFGLDQIYRRDLEVNGSRVDGTDQLASSLTLGTSVILGPRALLRLTAGIGLTDDASDYSFGMSLPVRFASPINWQNGNP
jgi:hypothetical protein